MFHSNHFAHAGWSEVSHQAVRMPRW